ncbi:hypothetical protein BWQ96_06527 [Gracilariopsis chorda]|uniref:DNA endonuclease activator Ctp1 C-terminal domain-containing protein n=1 Tax=Gracilariopsis chorda TaxID=448386 RepID=A0A2V3INR6_9FLOR|nr:hypothetical protein BWQ96_06527 [Gracilariopsis chorda]|eukprot:PXF43697.1 hypothetical protein BWQ96_06527 [Gracilariopsis chorda]
MLERGGTQAKWSDRVSGARYLRLLSKTSIAPPVKRSGMMEAAKRNAVTQLQAHLCALRATAPQCAAASTLSAIVTLLLRELTSLQQQHNALETRLASLCNASRTPDCSPRPDFDVDDALDDNFVGSDELTQPPPPLPEAQLSPAPFTPANGNTALISPAPLAPHSPQTANRSRLKRPRRNSRRPPRTPLNMDTLYTQQTPSPPPLPHVRAQLNFDQPTPVSEPPKKQSRNDTNEILAMSGSQPIREPAAVHRENETLLHKQTPTNAEQPSDPPVQHPRATAITGFRSVGQAVRAAHSILERQRQRDTPRVQRPLRGRDRNGLDARSCVECERFFRTEAAAHDNPQLVYQQLLKSACRHRTEYEQPATPDNFWQLTFEETATQPP